MVIFMYAIEAAGLTRKFNSFVAVDAISFSVKQGELFGLLGPNGAGKTTTINMLSTLLKPSSGTGTVAGFDIEKSRDSVRKNIGIVFQEPALDGQLTGKENLEFHAMMYGMGKIERSERIKEVLALVELSDRADTLVDRYSGGMKRRLEIARGLMHKPKVLFLDEPTLGLDAQTRRHIWEYIKKLNRESGVSIILTTHYMEEADYLCNRIAIVDSGKIVAMDTPEKLKNVLGGDVIYIEASPVEKAYNKMKKISWVKNASCRNSTVKLSVAHAEQKVPLLMKKCQESACKIKSVSIRKPSLEDVFIHFTGKTIREQEASQKERNREFARRRFGR